MRNFTISAFAVAALALAGCHHDNEKNDETAECLQDTAVQDTATDTAVEPAACTDETGTHASGETWTCPDGCNSCSCDNGSIVSTEMACPDTGDTGVPPDTGTDTGTDTGATDTGSGGTDTSAP